MNILRWGSNVIEGASPAGLIVAGAVLAVAYPPFRRTLRGAAVVATRGVLKAADTVKDSMAMLQEGWQDMTAEARGPMTDAGASAAMPKDGRRVIRGIRRHGRRLAVTAAAGALAMQEGLKDIVAEARDNRETARRQPLAAAGNIDLDCRCEPAASAEQEMPETPAVDARSEDPVKRSSARQTKAKSNL